MTVPDEKIEQQVWKLLSDAGLVEIRPNEFADRIKDVKHLVMLRLTELLEQKTNLKERESAAYSLGTLKKIETTLQEPPRKARK